MKKGKLLGGLLVLLLLCTCVGACEASMAVNIPVQSNPVGTWTGSGNFLVASYNVKLVCNADGTADLTGTYDVLGNAGALDEDLTWSSLGGDRYLGEAYGKSLQFTVDGNSLTVTGNPVRLGFVDNPLLNANYVITLTRQGYNPGFNMGGLVTNLFSFVGSAFTSILPNGDTGVGNLI